MRRHDFVKVIARSAAAMAFALSFPAHAETHVFCGLAGIGCGGMAELARKTGATLHLSETWLAVAEDIARRKPRDVRLAGCSCGGSAALNVATRLSAIGVNVARVAVYDGASVFCTTPAVPHNVARWRSFRQKAPIFGGASLAATRRGLETSHDMSHLELCNNGRLIEEGAAFLLEGPN